MDAHRFDHLIRRLALSGSRRSFAGVVLGGLAATAGVVPGEARKCGPCKRKRRGKCRSNPAQNGVICAPNRVCQNGGCVGFDQTCPAGANRCGGAEVPCGPVGAGCICFQRVGGGSFCGDTSGACESCTAETGCSGGKVCIQATGAGCGCPLGTSCATPCATLG